MRLKQKPSVRPLRQEKSVRSGGGLGRLVLVTGAGGFIGSHVVEALLERGAHVRALVHYSGSGRRGHLESIDASLQQRLEIVAGDVRNSHQLDALVNGCSTVAHLAALERKGIDGETIHFGQGSAVSVQELADICCRLLKKRCRIVTADRRVRPVKSGVDLLLCDPSKAREWLGWVPRIALEEVIRQTAAYIKKNLGTYRPGEYAQ